MGTSYLGLTNKLLRRLNEVEVTDAQFASVRNVQSAAKDCIIAAINEINTKEFEWPFNAKTGTTTLVAGQEEYTWPSDFSVPDWYSFRILKSEPLNSNNKSLKYLTKEDFFHYYRDRDDNNSPQGMGVPDFVFPRNAYGFGVTPSPNAAYLVEYQYFATPVDLVDYDDLSNIPTQFDYVIINYALKHFYMYKDNIEQAGFWSTEAEKSLRQMSSFLVNRDDYASSTVTNFGGSWAYSYFGGY